MLLTKKKATEEGNRSLGGASPCFVNLRHAEGVERLQLQAAPHKSEALPAVLTSLVSFISSFSVQSSLQGHILKLPRKGSEERADELSHSKIKTHFSHSPLSTWVLKPLSYLILEHLLKVHSHRPFSYCSTVLSGNMKAYPSSGLSFVTVVL